MKGLLVIIPCGQAKVWDKDPQRGPTPARSAYTGAPFKVNRQFAEHFAQEWLILSAKYGFIHPHWMLPGPYNVTFKRPATNPVDVPTLQAQARSLNLDRFDAIMVLGGKGYADAVKAALAHLQARLSFPFAGLPMGKAMQAAKTAIASGYPWPR